MENEPKKVECCRCGDVHTKDKRIEKKKALKEGGFITETLCPECDETAVYNLRPYKPQDEEKEVSDGH